MASTSKAPLFQIFQEPVTTFDHNEVRKAEAALYSALGPLADASQDSAIALESSYPEPSGLSPHKTSNRSSSPAAEALRETNLNSVRISPPQRETSQTDCLKKRPTMSQGDSHIPRLSQSKVMFATFQAPFSDKENAMAAPSSQSAPQGYSEGLYRYSTAPKRSLTDAALLRDRSQVKRAKIQAPESPNNEPLPDPSELPSFEDDGKKPSFSYAQLIGMAILRASNRRLTLAQIYKWISDSFSYYNLSENGWQNSIRHNLSLNKAFIKQERPKDDPGKGNYWAIETGMERQFLNHKNPRRGTISEGSTYHSLQEPVRPSTAPSLGSLPPSSIKHIDSSKFPAEEELSSDATIPASDPAIHDGVDDHGMPPPSTHNLRSSPPRGELHSSPPPMPAAVQRDDTPPRAPRFPSTSRSGGRKRKFASFGDSGYWSSIESSIPRGSAARGMLLTSEIDTQHPSLKRGRAEEEIARMRSSSFDSPTKARPILKGVTASSALASSPFRPFEATSHAPLTPPVVFKRPARPPKTVSPSTNLQIHRKRIADLVGSPDKSLSILEANLWSPAPATNHTGHIHDDFAVWKDEDINKAFELMDSPVARGSPEKRPAKRPNLGRAHTSSGVLADITGSSAGNTRLGAPFSPRGSILKPPMRFMSPLKQITSAPKLEPSPLRPGAAEFPDENELFSSALHSDDSDEAGFDILQGFQKIGAAPSMPPPPAPGVTHNGSPVKARRPIMHRSTTSMF